MERKGVALVSVVALLCLPSASRAANCSSYVCVDCEQRKGSLAKCIPVEYDASCECGIDVRFPEYCVLEGQCDYTGGGGGGGGGGVGTGSELCYRLPGQWCPAECSACETVFWL